MTTAFLTTRVAEVITETPRINRYRLVSNEGALPGFEAGAHMDVVCPDGQLRQYSLCNEPSDCPDYYEFAVLREDNGRGGSLSLHRGLSAESPLSVGVPRNHFLLQPATGRTLLLAGGIGITPLISMIHKLAAEGRCWHLHYCARSKSEAAFAEMLSSSAYAANCTFHFSRAEGGTRVDLDALMAGGCPEDMVYCCGPDGLVDAADSAAGRAGLAFRCERFSNELAAPASGDRAFEVEIASNGTVLEVPADRTILQVLRDNGIERDSMCEDGLCGSCETGLLGGEADHRDAIQTDEEKEEQTAIMVCCSRARKGRLVLDL